MASRRINDRSKYREKPRRNWPFLLVILLVLIITLLLLPWPAFASWSDSFVGKVWQMFSWGLAFVAIAVETLVWLVWRRKLSSLFRRWHQWLGAISLVAAAWGILSLFYLGGSIGSDISGYPDHAALVVFGRILGLLILSIIFVAPRAFFRTIAKLISWLWKLARRSVAPRPRFQEGPDFPSPKAPAFPSPEPFPSPRAPPKVS